MKKWIYKMNFSLRCDETARNQCAIINEINFRKLENIYNPENLSKNYSLNEKKKLKP